MKPIKKGNNLFMFLYTMWNFATLGRYLKKVGRQIYYYLWYEQIKKLH